MHRRWIPALAGAAVALVLSGCAADLDLALPGDDGRYTVGGGKDDTWGVKGELRSYDPSTRTLVVKKTRRVIQTRTSSGLRSFDSETANDVGTYVIPMQQFLCAAGNWDHRAAGDEPVRFVPGMTVYVFGVSPGQASRAYTVDKRACPDLVDLPRDDDFKMPAPGTGAGY